jgi:hypothetical protein
VSCLRQADKLPSKSQPGTSLYDPASCDAWNATRTDETELAQNRVQWRLSVRPDVADALARIVATAAQPAASTSMSLDSTASSRRGGDVGRWFADGLGAAPSRSGAAGYASLSTGSSALSHARVRGLSSSLTATETLRKTC